MAGDGAAPFDDLVHLSAGKTALIAAGKNGEIRWRNSQRLGGRTTTASSGAMTTGAVVAVQQGAGIGMIHGFGALGRARLGGAAVGAGDGKGEKKENDAGPNYTCGLHNARVRHLSAPGSDGYHLRL